MPRNGAWRSGCGVEKSSNSSCELTATITVNTASSISSLRHITNFTPARWPVEAFRMALYRVFNPLKCLPTHHGIRWEVEFYHFIVVSTEFKSLQQIFQQNYELYPHSIYCMMDVSRSGWKPRLWPGWTPLLTFRAPLSACGLDWLRFRQAKRPPYKLYYL